MRKSFVRIFCVFFIMLLAGCKKEASVVKKSKFDDSKQCLQFLRSAESDEGIYYVENVDSGEVIKYIDRSSLKETVLCSKVNCKHNSKSCQAFAEELDFMQGIIYRDGKIYLLLSCKDGENETRSQRIYQMEKDGSNKKLIHEFKNTPVPSMGGCLYKNYFFVSAQVMEMEEDGSGGSSGASSILMYNLDTKEETVVLDGYKENNTLKVMAGAKGNSVYIAERNLYERGNCRFREYDLLTGEIQDFYTTEEENIQEITGDILYLQEKAEKKIYTYNVKTQEKKEFLSWDDDIAEIYIGDSYIGFVKEEENSEGETLYWHKWYDFEEEDYLFEEYSLDTQLDLKRKLTDIYWFVKNGKNYFYDPKEKKWSEVKEIS